MEQEMRFIEDLRNTKHGEMWLIGTGKSLDDFPLDFFNGKTFIAMRPCDVIFPNCVYSICSYNDKVLEPYFKKNLHLLKKQIFTLNPRHRKNWLGKYNKLPIFMRTFKPYSFNDSEYVPLVGRRVAKVHVQETIKSIMEGTSSRYASRGIIQGWTIEAALVLGAKKITLVGCDYIITGSKWRWHADRLSFFYAPMESSKNLLPTKRGYSKSQLEMLKKWLEEAEKETRWMAEMLEPCHIELARYFYGEGYRKVGK